MAFFTRDKPTSASPAGIDLETVKRLFQSYWGFGPRAEADLGEIADRLRDAGLSREQLGALSAWIPNPDGPTGRRCDRLRQLVAGVEKETA